MLAHIIHSVVPFQLKQERFLDEVESRFHPNYTLTLDYQKFLHRHPDISQPKHKTQ